REPPKSYRQIIDCSAYRTTSDFYPTVFHVPFVQGSRFGLYSYPDECHWRRVCPFVEGYAIQYIGRCWVYRPVRCRRSERECTDFHIQQIGKRGLEREYPEDYRGSQNKAKTSIDDSIGSKFRFFTNGIEYKCRCRSAETISNGGYRRIDFSNSIDTVRTAFAIPCIYEKSQAYKK